MIETNNAEIHFCIYAKQILQQCLKNLILTTFEFGFLLQNVQKQEVPKIFCEYLLQAYETTDKLLTSYVLSQFLTCITKVIIPKLKTLTSKLH